MKFNFKKANKVYGYYYYCTICNKQIDYYEHLKYNGKCELCYYCKRSVIIMRDYEKLRIRETLATIKFMQKMKFDKYVILNNLDSIIEKLRVNASNEFINCLFDIHQKVVLDKEIKKEMLL